jgi:hypothetical protein
MLLIIFVGLIAKLTLGSGNQDDNIVDWNQVGISLLERFLNQEAFQSVDWDYISSVVPLTNCQ